MGFARWLGLLFIGLKLTGYIDWPWVWVSCPLWTAVVLIVITEIGKKLKEEKAS